MDRSVLTRALLRLRWQTERLGGTGKIGFGLLIFSVVFFFAAVLPRHAESRALREQAEAARLHLRAEPMPVSVRKVQRDQGLGDFYAFFPGIDSTPHWIGELVQAAAAAHVELSGSEYRMVRDQGWKLARYEMMLPVRGNYSQIRAFIGDSLRVAPAVALVDMAIKREHVGSDLLEANLKFHLYLNESRKR
ncbi:hypothetical protein [Nitrosovibrio sp. Nv17]|uniref:hypothetical protein n=1 Tax=Nitrosovibrio sp. Nv17 TaxID=1855339 RepID=UPI000908E61F|nr:hypothetical protein [Nitrosovibrio sp. Nv17]SFW37744.1 hypothetical protein SAMN05216414_12710 [Nitrosovibrio sp. Nv17]